jgi:hypothetical protein
LGQIITRDQNDTLDRVEKAMEEFLSDDKEDPLGGIDMVHYFSIILSQTTRCDGDEVPLLGRVMSQALSLKKYPCASIVYVAYENSLIFDRYQNGLLIPDLGTVFTNSKPNKLNPANDTSTHEDESAVHATLLPGAILEFILSFLPDEAVASMARVCSAWHNEIGMSSSHLWQNLLDRRQWPCCDRTRNAANDNHDDAQRSFKMHYEVVRDVRAVRDALVSILNPRLEGAAEEVDMVYQSLQKRKGGPVGECVGMAMWSPTEVLAANEIDCLIRLFKAAEKGSGGGRTCRELISVCFDPCRKMTKAQTRLHAMALGDSNIIAMTSSVLTSPRYYRRHRLSVVSRDDYLSAAGNTTSGRGWSELDEGALTIVNIEEMIISVMMETDDEWVDQPEFDVTLSHSIVACGKDRFLLQAFLTLRGHNDINGDQHTSRRSKFVVFSTLTCTIVSMSPGPPIYPSPWGGDYVMMVGLTRSTGGRQTGCRAVSVVTGSPDMIISEIDASGRIVSVQQHEGSEIARSTLLDLVSLDWYIDPFKPRLVTLFDNAVVTADVLREGNGNYCSFVSLYPLGEAHDDDFENTMKVFEGCIVMKMHRVRDNYLLLLCEELDSELESDFILERELDHRDRLVSASAMILHMSTLEVISRVSLPLDTSTMMSMWSLCSSDTMLCVGADARGVVMTGRDIRAVNDRHLLTKPKGDVESSSNEEKKKKKKARLTSGSGKKDGFARGMRQSG